MVVTEPVPIGVARGRARAARVGRTSATARSREHLTRVALSLNSALGLDAVLGELTALTLAATGADRCSVFLLDGDRYLSPAVAAGTPADEGLWRTFRSLAPLDVREAPGLATFLTDGRAVAAPVAGACPLIPHAWVDTFGVRSAAIVPLHALGEVCGVLAVDYRHLYDLTADDADLLESLAACAGLAIRNARLFDAERRRAHVHTAAATAAAALAAPQEPAAVARTVLAAYDSMLGVRAGVVALSAGAGWAVTTVAGAALRVEATAVPERLRSVLAEAWRERARPVTLPADEWLSGTLGDAGGTYVALPLGAGGRRGVVLLAPGRTLRADEYAAAETLAAVASGALARAQLDRRVARQARQAQVLDDLASTLPERSDAAGILRRLDELLAEDGVTVASLRVKDRRLARHLGVAGALPAREPAGGQVSVPMQVGRRVVGELAVTSRGRADVPYLEAVARTVAEVATRGATAAALEEAARERGVAAERERIAADLNDSVGQLFVGIGLLAQRSADELPADSPWAARFGRLADVAREGKWVVDDAERALAFVPAGGRGLVPTLRALARSVSSDSGLSVVVETAGRPRRIAAVAEQALYRVANQALANAWRHGRCTTVVVEVAYAADAVSVSVRDDGAGLGQRESSEGHGGFGMAGMRRGIVAAGGTLRVANRVPCGAVVEARVPVGAR